MKTTRYFFFLFIFITIGAFGAKGQEVKEDSIVNRNVTVEREYRPEIQEAGKINNIPSVSMPKVNKITPYYTTDFSKPLNVDKNIHYLSAADVNLPVHRSKEGFARLGIGTGFNSLANFAYPLYNKNDNRLDFSLNHDGFFNDKAHSVTDANLGFNKKFDLFDYYIGLRGSHEYLKYYGKNFLSLDEVNFFESDSVFSGKNNLWRLNATTGLYNSPKNEDWRFYAFIDYNMFEFASTVNNIWEHQIVLRAEANAEVVGNRLGIGFLSSTQFYNKQVAEMPELLPDELKAYSVLSLNPYYAFEKELWDLRVGLKTFFSISEGRGFSLVPDVRFDWRFFPKYMAFYAGIGGDYTINSISDILNENRYFQPGSAVNDTYIPLDLFAGIKIKPFKGFLFDAFIDYKMINNQYFFVNNTFDVVLVRPNGGDDALLAHNRFVALYSKAKQLRVGARISYNYYDRFDIAFDGAYNHWNVDQYEYAWQKPAWELNFSTRVKVLSKLDIYANAAFDGGRYARLNNTVVEMDPKININIGADYSLFDFMSVFVKVNNLINNKYEYWHGYEAQGFNFTGGVVFDF